MSVPLPSRVRRQLLRAMGEPPERWPRPVVLPQPPAPAVGQVTGPPDFVGVGVQKAGTSWWFDLVIAHPGVAEPFRKELHYFDGFYGAPFGPAEVDTYHRFFPRAAARLVGEWTPRYLHDVWSVPLLAQAAPDARVLVLLRDPVERYRSGLAHDLARHAPDNPLVASTHVERGDYAAQLGHLFGHVPPDRVLVLQYERCLVDTAGQLARTYRFLGLDGSFVPGDLDRQVNVTATAKPVLPAHQYEALVSRYSAELDELCHLVPDLDPSLWPNVRPQ
jgi:Sulfotransferase family